MLGIDLAGGAGIFAAFLALYLAGVVVGLYTRRGSGINHHPFFHVHDTAPGARGDGMRRADVASWSRGCR